ncbi:FYVE, RhoGEF and PH domain-containing protein 5 isoform X1 [Colossoma macropomum]|uniref:FYVE, RhoGEF and PH domain-containing protein 5 isoform X1 n=1 Tax=Colossoma macropomum TaxID=42526 RepID=UPI0018640567|nr:FYVE, RhoGEF and PH domain-containing protein 5 isoform X1 [Colossoma macropomum]
MDTDYHKQLPSPRPKIQSRLTITVRSTLMSRPCLSSRGPKPPVAPKPRLSTEQEDEHNQSIVSNGDIVSSDRLELEQDGESEATQDEADTPIENSVELAEESFNIAEEQVEANPNTSDGISDKDVKGDLEMRVEETDEIAESEEEERENSIEANNAGLNDVQGFIVTTVSAAVDYIKDTGDVEPPQGTGDLDDTADDPAEYPEKETLTEDQTEDETEVNNDTPSPYEEIEESTLNQGTYAEIDNVEDVTSDPVDDIEEPYFNERESFLSEPPPECDNEPCEEGTNPSVECALSEATEDTTNAEAGFSSQAMNGSQPSLCEEYPYDVIGSLDDTDSWQPERATKDPSGRFRFSEEVEDAYEPYSVIEVVPADLMSTSDPEADCTDEECGDKKVKDTETETAITSNQEPFYVSSDDVAELEEQQAQLGDSVPSTSEPSEQQGTKVDEYADIDDSLCQDGDDQPLECVSSEDYVEIGDEDEPVDMERKTKGKSAKERSARRSQGFVSQRNSCQPRLRLCNITVPADLDLGMTPELTNRVVFAHTTEAFEEDIEDLDCHIVPFFEDSDSDSDEHIYEEAGFDSEGENFISLDRKTIVTRSRSLSGKVPGYVPETVPEETGNESQTHDYYTVTLDQNGDLLKPSDNSEVNRMIPSMKSRRFLFYPRSYSVEGRDVDSLSAYLGSDSPQVENKVKRKDDTLSLPCVITSSGSFSQRSHQSSSGVSTPTSLVDIPPPFELAYITKRPVTKSSPSLLIQHESSDKPKKKKTSFKRFLALKFRKKTDSKTHGDGSVRSSRSSSESSHHGPVRVIELDRRSTSSSPQLQSRIVKSQRNSDFPATFVVYKDRQKRNGVPKTYGNRGISRVESFEDRSRPPFMPLPLTKPRSISFPSADTSDYENIPAMSSDYENIQIPPGRPTRSVTITEFFDDHNRTTAPANENDGYVDMNSFAGIENKTNTQEQEAESAYTEPFPVCPAPASLSADEDHGRTSEEEEGCGDHSYDRQIDGRSRAYYVAKELLDSEREHLKTLKLLQEDFREAVEEAVGDDGEPVLEEGRLGEILSTLPQAYQLHLHIFTELDTKIKQWEDSPRVVGVFLTSRAEFGVFTTYINEYDRNMALLEESCRRSQAFADIVKQFEQQNAEGVQVPVKHQLQQVIVRVLQYRMLLTDYLNNLSPDSKEYEDTQAALVIVSEIADQANDSLKEGENLLRLVHIESSVKGKRALLQPGRVFVKEGTLMKVSRKSRQPRHLFLMNDVMLYTYPQQDGKYRLKNTLPLSGMKVSKPVVDNVLNTLRIEVNDVTITLSASSLAEREDWFHTLSRAIADHAAGLNTFSSSSEAREKLWMSLGEAAPVLVPISHAMMCMNCASDFSLTLRRHHCNACGKVVCRACSRNRYPLKYLKDRVAKVCDRCYTELKKRGGNVPMACGSASPHTNRASRPLSAVFQSLQTPSLWKSRKSTSPLAQVSVGAEGSTMSGSLQRRKKSKRKWKRLWFLLKDKVLYTFTAREDKVASESLPLQGFTVKLSEHSEGEDTDSIFQLYHKKTLYYTFRADDQHTARRWVNAMEEATVL